MNKTILIILAALALITGGVWFYLRSVTQTGGINEIRPAGRPAELLFSPRPSGGEYPGSSTRPIIASPSAQINLAPSPSRSPNSKPNIYIPPAQVVD